MRVSVFQDEDFPLQVRMSDDITLAIKQRALAGSQGRRLSPSAR